jgi:hypothetical protein
MTRPCFGANRSSVVNEAHRLPDALKVASAVRQQKTLRHRYQPQAAWPTMYHKAITLSGTPSNHATI